MAPQRTIGRNRRGPSGPVLPTLRPHHGVGIHIFHQRWRRTLPGAAPSSRQPDVVQRRDALPRQNLLLDSGGTKSMALSFGNAPGRAVVPCWFPSAEIRFKECDIHPRRAPKLPARSGGDPRPPGGQEAHANTPSRLPAPIFARPLQPGSRWWVVTMEGLHPDMNVESIRWALRLPQRLVTCGVFAALNTSRRRSRGVDP